MRTCLILILWCCSSVLVYANTYYEDYSGQGHWYLSLGYEAGKLDQSLTGQGNYDVAAPVIALGGVGPQAVRFEVSWARLADSSGDWITSGMDADLWLPGDPTRRLRPYLIMGAGLQRYYGDRSSAKAESFFNQEGADNEAVSYKFGLALVGNITRTLEADVSFLHRIMKWDANTENDDGREANATVNALRFSLRQLF
jgi:hypothetical protein